jgi:hypothetical protein
MKKALYIALMLMAGHCGLAAQDLHETARTYLSKALYDSSSLVIDCIAPIDTLTVGKSLQAMIDETDPATVTRYVFVDFGGNVSCEEQRLANDMESQKANDKMKLEHDELMKLRDLLVDRLDEIIRITYEIKFHANGADKTQVDYRMVFRVDPEGNITEMAEDTGKLRYKIGFVEYNRLRNKMYNEIVRWD